MSATLPTLVEAKAQAKRLRTGLEAEGREISHSQSLELVARQHGVRDWNTFHAAMGNRPPEGFTPGGRIEGTYLSQPFAATVLAVEMLRPGWFRLELDLDEAVDVVTFDSFSNFRKRIRGTVGPSGTSRERTSDGTPHLVIEI
ncbi:glyoxalase superfamily protein [Pseudophaeobacter sp. C1-32P7]|uniref:glyoxalase superfamily protein n=1 Tax=Pseudophaeobacter sp. C1-32P7 TaxID=3098142 RepID=UPI0034D5D318